MKVGLVDDRKIEGILLACALEGSDWDMVWWNSAEDMDLEGIDAVVADFFMAADDTAVAAIHKAKAANLPVVIYSGASLRLEVQQAAEEEGVEVIAKKDGSEVLEWLNRIQNKD